MCSQTGSWDCLGWWSRVANHAPNHEKGIKLSLSSETFDSRSRAFQPEVDAPRNPWRSGHVFRQGVFIRKRRMEWRGDQLRLKLIAAALIAFEGDFHGWWSSLKLVMGKITATKTKRSGAHRSEWMAMKDDPDGHKMWWKMIAARLTPRSQSEPKFIEKGPVDDSRLQLEDTGCPISFRMDISEAVCISTLMLLYRSRVVANVIWKSTANPRLRWNSSKTTIPKRLPYVFHIHIHGAESPHQISPGRGSWVDANSF